jgi:hypothetical protein
MLIEQIHFPQNGPSLGKIALISLAAIGTVIVVCQIAKSYKLNVQPISPKKDDEND